MGKDVTWGMPGHLTPDQERTLAELRRRVDGELPRKPWLERDAALLRFLRARNFDIHKAFRMIAEDVEWREPFENYVFIRSRDFRGAFALHMDQALKLAGKTLDGRPLLVSRVRHYHPNLVDDVLQITYFFLFYVDAVCRIAEAAGHETFVIILDLQGFSLANFSIEQVRAGLLILQGHFPERLGAALVINAPFVFVSVWTLVKPLLDDRTRAKVEILGSDLSKLKNYVSSDVLETDFGGTHPEYTVPDEICQVSIDNEKYLRLDGELGGVVPADGGSRPSSSAAVGDGESGSAGTASTPLPPAVVETAAKRQSVRRRMRRLVKKMLFISEKRELAASIGVDPDSLDDSPKKLVTSPSSSGLSPLTRRAGSSGAGLGAGAGGSVRGRLPLDAESDVEPQELDKEILEIKLAHDKLLGRIQDVEQHLGENTARLQTQIHALLAVLMGLIAWILAVAGGVASVPSLGGSSASASSSAA